MGTLDHGISQMEGAILVLATRAGGMCVRVIDIGRVDEDG
jgi:hypothetical protein